MVKLKFRNFLGQILEKPANKEKTESREDNDDKKKTQENLLTYYYYTIQNKGDVDLPVDICKVVESWCIFYLGSLEKFEEKERERKISRALL